MVNWAGLAGILACVGGIFAGRLYKGTDLPLPYPAIVPVGRYHPDKLPSFGPLEGPYATNEKLKNATKLFEGQIHGSESVALARDGSLWMLDKYGYVWRAPEDGKGSYALEKEPLAQLGPGRPLGFDFDKQGNLIVCNSGSGLVMLEKDSKKVVLLTSRVSADDPLDPDSTIDYINDVVAASDGIIYFTDSVQGIMPRRNAYGFWDTMEAYMLTLFQGEPSGRLLSYNPATRKTHVVAQEFWFANGVALSKDEDFIAVVETNTQTVHKVWLTGAKAGQKEVLISKMPGFLDGITTSSTGTFWVAVVVPKMDLVRYLSNKVVRFVVAWLPQEVKPPVPEWGAVVEVHPDGRALQALYDSDGTHVQRISAVTEAGDRLYFGNLAGDYVSFIQKPAETCEQT
ncbi:g12664 [Coccomyxa viridis]|uniref:G12664 protein n=1 Tax=Coccomyxa viridis TaxID=1274662 RepID=A0ABP1GF74_9CHLO